MNRGKKFRVIGVCLAGLFLLIIVSLLTQDFRLKRRLQRLEAVKVQCGELAVQQEWEQLESAASEWVELDESSADAWLNLAEAYQQQGFLTDCVESLLRIPINDPKAPQAMLFAAEMQLNEAGQPSEGLATLRALRKLAPRAEPVRKHLISIYAMTLQRQKMIDEIYDAFRYHAEPPEAYVYLMLANHLSFTNGVQLNTRWLTAEPESELFSIARAVQLVDTLKNLQTTSPETELQRKAGEEELDLLLNKYPNNLALLHYKIESAILDEDIEQVGRLLTRIPETEAQDSLSLRYAGWHFMKTQRPREAEDAYRQSISLMPMDWHAWHELASALRNQGKLEDAEAAAKVAIVGKELRKDCLALPDAGQPPAQLLDRILEYAAQCGADHVASSLHFQKLPVE